MNFFDKHKHNKTAQHCPLVAEETEKNIPDLQTLPEMQAELNRLDSLRRQLKEVIERLNGKPYTEADPGNPAPVISLDEAAKRVYQGEDLNSLTTTRPENAHSKLVDSKIILERAVELQMQRISQVEAKVIQEVCATIAPAAKEITAQVVESFEQLAESLEVLGQFYWLLGHRGYRPDRRPKHWNPWPFEQQVANGLEEYLERKKQIWNL